MKTSLEQEDIQAIASAVIEMLKPMLSVTDTHAGDRWLTVKRLADYMGMSPQWIHNNKGKLPHVYIGNKPLFRKSEIDSWLLNQRTEHNYDRAMKPHTCTMSAFKAKIRQR